MAINRASCGGAAGQKKRDIFAVRFLKMPKDEAPTPSPGSRKNVRLKCQRRSALAPKNDESERDGCMAQERRSGKGIEQRRK